MPSRLATLLLALPLLSASAAPFDWPQWRGPQRDGVCTETGLLQQWPTDGPPLAWKRTGLGGGYTAPAVAASRLYGMSYRGNNEVVWALKESNGEPLWAT